MTAWSGGAEPENLSGSRYVLVWYLPLPSVRSSKAIFTLHAKSHISLRLPDSLPRWPAYMAHQRLDLHMQKTYVCKPLTVVPGAFEMAVRLRDGAGNLI